MRSEDETATFTMIYSGLYVMNKYVERYWQDDNVFIIDKGIIY